MEAEVVLVHCRILRSLGLIVLGSGVAVSEGVAADSIAFPHVEAIASQPGGTTANFPLVTRALLPADGGSWMAFGDTDHDGRREVVFTGYNAAGSCCFPQIQEHQGNNVYTQAYVGTDQLNVRGVDDLDGDGKAEIIGQSGSQVLVYEAPDASSPPSVLIWASQPFNNTIGRFAFGDTDRDGHREIIYGVPGAGTIAIFESTGDNTFQTFLIPTGSGGVGDFLIADLDGDGLQEIVCDKSNASLLKIFESPANDTWVQTYSVPTVLHPNQIEGGHDVDGDGIPDLFVGGDGAVDGVHSYRTVVYKSSGDNQLAPVDTFEVTDGSSGALVNALGDLDGLGVEEYVVDSGIGLWVFRPFSVGDWGLIGQVPDPDGTHQGIFSADVNENGRSEVFWLGGNRPLGTLLLEYSSGVSDATPNIVPRPMQLSLYPNPCMSAATIRVPASATDAATLAIFDVGGRLIERQAFRRDVLGNAAWQRGSLAPGVYLFRVEDARTLPLATGRAVVIER